MSPFMKLFIELKKPVATFIEPPDFLKSDIKQLLDGEMN